MPNEETVARISQLKPSEVADDVIAAVRDLGAEALLNVPRIVMESYQRTGQASNFV